MTLVCHHPELATNHMHGKYRTSIPQWRENGSSITPTVASVYTAITAQDLMSTALTINITVDHFGNKSLGYSCFLVLDENGKPGELDSSQEVTVDPVGECLKISCEFGNIFVNLEDYISSSKSLAFMRTQNCMHVINYRCPTTPYTHSSAKFNIECHPMAAKHNNLL